MTKTKYKNITIPSWKRDRYGIECPYCRRILRSAGYPPRCPGCGGNVAAGHAEA